MTFAIDRVRDLFVRDAVGGVGVGGAGEEEEGGGGGGSGGGREEELKFWRKCNFSLILIVICHFLLPRNLQRKLLDIGRF